LNSRVDFIFIIWGNTAPVRLAGGFRPETVYKAVAEIIKIRILGLYLGDTSSPTQIWFSKSSGNSP
jgi:hypothetical protein